MANSQSFVFREAASVSKQQQQEEFSNVAKTCLHCCISTRSASGWSQHMTELLLQQWKRLRLHLFLNHVTEWCKHEPPVRRMP